MTLIIEEEPKASAKAFCSSSSMLCFDPQAIWDQSIDIVFFDHLSNNRG